MARFLCWEYRDAFAYIVVMSATANANGFYSKFLPKEHVHSFYDPSLIEKLIAKQEAFWQRGQKVHCLLILDDVIGMDGVNMRAPPPELQKLFTCNRHFGISLLISVQNVRAVPPICRNNSDFACIFKSLNVAKEILYREYSNMPKKAFYEFLEEYTSNFRIIMYAAREQNPQKVYTVFKIPEAFLEKAFKLKF